jgi:hypothetical protein
VVSELEITPLINATGIRLVGELDFSTAPRFTDALRGVSPGDELQLDLTELILVDSAGLPPVQGPRPERKEAAYFENAELPRLFAHVNDEPYRTLCLVALKTGMSRGATRASMGRR